MLLASRRFVLSSLPLLGTTTQTFAAAAASATAFTISSPAFRNGAPIPPVYSRCDGDDRSPPLQWTGVPDQTESLVLIVDDPDAPDPEAPKMTWAHWVLYNIPPAATGLPEGVAPSSLPRGALSARNDWKTTGYGGPSPPVGAHRYFHKLYALDRVIPDLGASADKASVVKAMDGHILAQAELIGTYKKAGGSSS